MAKNLFLCHSSTRPQRLTAAMSQETGSIPILFLCQDFVDLKRWEQASPERYEFGGISDSLAKVAERLRDPYLTLISQLGSEYPSDAWWASRVSERNTMVSGLFLHCCYVKLLWHALTSESEADTRCIISESWAVLESAADIAQQNGYSVYWSEREERLSRWFGLPRRILLRVGKLCLRVMLGRLLKRYSSPPEHGRPLVLIHTFVDEACLGSDGRFVERYFPGLSAWLERQGFKVYMLPVLSNVKCSITSTWRWFRQSDQAFINPYSYYRLSDCVAAVRTAWTSFKMPERPVHLDGLDLSPLFEDERRRFAFETLDAILYLELPKRLASAGFDFDRCITEYEGMIPEKMLILGFRRHSPSTALIGCQHSALSPMILCFFVTPQEAEFAPLPDRVVCNGDFSCSILVEQGLPDYLAFSGPALRYTHLHDDVGGCARVRKDNQKSAVLVLLSWMTSDAMELMAKIGLAFGDSESCHFYIKPHPMSSAEQLESVLRDPFLPPSYEVVDGSMAEWLGTADLVLTIGSSAGFEAFAAGVPLINVGRDRAINLNALGYTEGASQLFFDPEEIRAEAERLLSWSSTELAQYRRQASKAKAESFGRVTDESMRLFIDVSSSASDS